MKKQPEPNSKAAASSAPLHFLIVGASGYIGRALIDRLLATHPQATITALSRSHPPRYWHMQGFNRVAWKTCDLFVLSQVQEALQQPVDVAYYLVHSMSPTAQLDQGSFADYDLLLSEHFAKVLQKIGCGHLIYLGGLIPEDTRLLSPHLQSRLEVEKVFEHSGLPLTLFRAGMILGEYGSSFQILLKLINRLPVMLCPQWTQTLTTPVDLPQVLDALTESAGAPQHFGKTYDLKGCEALTYVELMAATAQHAGKRRLFFAVPYFTPTISRFWVSLITQTPKSLVYPLVESLQHAMVARDSHLFYPLPPHRRVTYVDLLKTMNLKVHPSHKIFHFHPQRNTVRSLQRLPLPPGKDAQWVAAFYEIFLSTFLKPLLRVQMHEGVLTFSLFFPSWVLLQLKRNQIDSHPDLQLFEIQKGWLVGDHNRGQLEFRVVFDRKYVIAAIHNYRPALPWFIYCYTQALVHLWIMRAFARKLSHPSLELLHTQASELEASLDPQASSSSSSSSPRPTPSPEAPPPSLRKHA